MKRRRNDRATKWGLRRRLVELEQECEVYHQNLRDKHAELERVHATLVSHQDAYRELLAKYREVTGG